MVCFEVVLLSRICIDPAWKLEAVDPKETLHRFSRNMTLPDENYCIWCKCLQTKECNIAVACASVAMTTWSKGTPPSRGSPPQALLNSPPRGRGGTQELDQNTVPGRVRAKMAKYERKWQILAKIGFFTVLAALVSLWLGMQRLCALLLPCLHVCGSILSVRMRMHLVMLAIVPKCFCLFVQRSIECLLVTDGDAKVPESTMGKEHGRGSPTSPDFIGFSEKCSHECVETKTQVGFTNNQDRICHGSAHTIFNILIVCSFNVNVECVRDCIFRLDWRLARHATVACFGVAPQNVDERDDRLWLCNVESSRNCNAMVRTWKGNGAEGVTEIAGNITENVRNVPKNVRKVTKNVRKSNEKASEGRETL